ncbi:MAG: LysM peptidoglycan-binding domain-containing protein [Alphaproteobacteria bacterium]
MKATAPTTILLLIFSLVLSGCFGSGSGASDPSEIQPVYRIRNAPIPVPTPGEKPTPPGRSASASSSSTSGSITVRKGDTVYAISRRTGVDPRAIIAANNLKPPYVLHPGDTLVLTGGQTYAVKRGDTLYSISRSFGIDMTSLSRANNLKSPYRLAIGQVLQIPGGRAVQRTQTALNVVLPPREGSRFLWPVKGDILSSYGAKDGGLHNDGINIKTRRGEPVKAADAGVVVYADDGLKGYGNLILIRHQGGWVTAYAHNDKLLVKRGDAVKRGDVISWAGVTGDVSQAQLHFEIRKGTRAVNPISYLEG